MKVLISHKKGGCSTVFIVIRKVPLLNENNKIGKGRDEINRFLVFLLLPIRMEGK